MLYFASGQRQITGIDYDKEKIETAIHCFSKTPAINFVHSDVEDFDFEKYDAIILADVLHYLQREQQTRIIEKCIRQLNSGGRIIIRDGDTDAAIKHKRTQWTEFFSTRVFMFNKTGKKGLTFFSGRSIRETAARHNMECREISDSAITSNTIFVLTKSAGE